MYTSSASVVYHGQHLLDATEEAEYCKVHFDDYNATKVYLPNYFIIKKNIRKSQNVKYWKLTVRMG